MLFAPMLFGNPLAEFDATWKGILRLNFICIEIAVKFLKSQLLLKLELLLSGSCRTSRLGITKFKMHHIGSFIKFSRVSEILLHGRFLVYFEEACKRVFSPEETLQTNVSVQKWVGCC